MKKARKNRAFSFMVRKRGFEPPRPCGHKLLRLARLPVPPLPHEEGTLNRLELPIIPDDESLACPCATAERRREARGIRLLFPGPLALGAARSCRQPLNRFTTP